MSSKKRRLRREGGAAMIGLVISILFFVLFLGLFAFDANRAQMCQRELIAACDSASITGTAMLASYDTSPNGQVHLDVAQQLSAGYAYNMFRRAVVLGQPLTNAQLVNSTSALQSVSSPNQCNLIIALGDPSNGFKSISYAGDPAGRTVEIFTAYGYAPEFLSALPFGMKVTPMSASSFGGLPQVDAVVVFDYSGSMDDFTSVLFVRREWWWPSTATSLTGAGGTGPGLPLYSVVTGANPGSNNLFSNYLKWNYTIQPAGSGTNVLPPQNIQAVGSGNTAVGNPLTYTNAVRSNPIFCAQWLGNACMASGGNSDTAHYMPFKSPGGKPLTLSSADYGQPPGNYKPVFVCMTSQLDAFGVNQIAKVSSLTPDSPLSDTNQAVDANHPIKPDGHPSFWWNHRGTGGTPSTPSTTAISGTTNQPGSLLVSYNNPSALYGFAFGGFEPNTWGYSLYNITPTATYHSGYPRQSNALLNSPYKAIANDMVGDNGFFTDLIVNIVNPTNGGSSYQTQPIPAITASSLSNFYYNPGQCNMTFPSDEPDVRLAGKPFNFENLATVVEAARGNLDNSSNYIGACLDGNIIIRPYVSSSVGAASVLPATPATTTVTASSASVSPYWQLAYERIAMLESQPYATATDGAENGFFYKLSTLADCRFGFIGFSAVTQSGSDDYGASNSNCLTAYPAKHYPSQGTASAFSHLHSGVQHYYNSSSYYYGANCNQCWWRTNQNITPAAGGPSYAGPAGPTLNESVWAFTAPSTTSSQNGSGTDQGFKIPRTRLSTKIPTGGTQSPSQLCMVASHPSGGATPYNVAPYGDVWSSTADNPQANGVWNGRPMTDTYCDEALTTGYNYFIKASNSSYDPTQRYAARKAIVFFTDGEPTGGISGSTATNSTAVANLCKSKQIAIFTIGLNMDPTNNGTLTAHQYQFLGDGVNASYAGAQNGLAFTASNGSRFFQCQDGASVRSAFASIARRLSQAQF